MERVQYLGYIVNEHGVHVDLENIQAILDWSTLMTLIELLNLLGLTNLYHIFLLGFSNIAWSLI